MGGAGRHGRLARLVVFTALALAVVEISARVYLRARGIPAESLIQVNSALCDAREAGSGGLDTDYPHLPFRPLPGAGILSEVNSLGLIGVETGWEPTPGSLRVLCLSGSMVCLDDFRGTSRPARTASSRAAAHDTTRARSWFPAGLHGIRPRTSSDTPLADGLS